MNDSRVNILKEVESLFDLSANNPGYVCLIHNDDKVPFSQCVGKLDDLDKGLSEESVFRIASLTKQFTAAAILQLVDTGKLTLDTKIRTVLTDIPLYCEDITIHHLLTHTSGLRDYEGAKNLDATKKFVDQDVLDVLNLFDDLEFKPGTSYHYSNAGYCLLALVIAKVSGTSYKEYLKTNIFEKADMTTAQVGTDLDVTNRVYGYSWGGTKWDEHDQDIFTHTEGDGGIYASAIDLIKWQSALYEKNLIISEASIALMTSGHTPTNYEGEDYGYGIAVTTINSATCYLHHGVSSGFENALFYLPEYKTSIVILSNMKHPEFNTISLGKKLVSSYLHS